MVVRPTIACIRRDHYVQPIACMPVSLLGSCPVSLLASTVVPLLRMPVILDLVVLISGRGRPLYPLWCRLVAIKDLRYASTAARQVLDSSRRITH